MTSNTKTSDLASMIRDSRGRSLTPHSTVSSRRQTKTISVDDFPYASEQTRRLVKRDRTEKSTRELFINSESDISRQNTRPAKNKLSKLPSEFNTYPASLLRKTSQEKMSRTNVRSASKSYLDRTSTMFEHSTEMKAFQAFLSYLKNPEDSDEDSTDQEATNLNGDVGTFPHNSPSSPHPNADVSQPNMTQDTPDAAESKPRTSSKKRKAVQSIKQFPAYDSTHSSSDEEEVATQRDESPRVATENELPPEKADHEDASHSTQKTAPGRETPMPDSTNVSKLPASEENTGGVTPGNDVKAVEKDGQPTQPEPIGEKREKDGKSTDAATIKTEEDNEEVQDGHVDVNEEQLFLEAAKTPKKQKKRSKKTKRFHRQRNRPRGNTEKTQTDNCLTEQSSKQTSIDSSKQTATVKAIENTISQNEGMDENAELNSNTEQEDTTHMNQENTEEKNELQIPTSGETVSLQEGVQSEAGLSEIPDKMAEEQKSAQNTTDYDKFAGKNSNGVNATQNEIQTTQDREQPQGETVQSHSSDYKATDSTQTGEMEPKNVDQPLKKPAPISSANEINQHPSSEVNTKSKDESTPTRTSPTGDGEITPRHSELTECGGHIKQGRNPHDSETGLEANDAEYSDDFAVSDEDVDSGRGTRQDSHEHGCVGKKPPAVSEATKTGNKATTKKSQRKNETKLHYSLIDTPYMNVPLRNIYSSKDRKELGILQSKKRDIDKVTESMYCYMCGNMTDDANHAIRANLRYHKVSKASTGNSSFYFIAK